MSAPFGSYALTLDDITKQMRGTVETFVEPRKGKNTSYTMIDAALSACSVFFTPSPSFLEYPHSLEQTQGHNNARTLFGVLRCHRTTTSAACLMPHRRWRSRRCTPFCSTPWHRPG